MNLEDKTWDDDLGEWEYLRIGLHSEEDGYVELPDDEARRAMFELTERTTELLARTTELNSDSIELEDDQN